MDKKLQRENLESSAKTVGKNLVGFYSKIFSINKWNFRKFCNRGQNNTKMFGGISAQHFFPHHFWSLVNLSLTGIWHFSQTTTQFPEVHDSPWAVVMVTFTLLPDASCVRVFFFFKFVNLHSHCWQGSTSCAVQRWHQTSPLLTPLSLVGVWVANGKRHKLKKFAGGLASDKVIVWPRPHSLEP